MPFSSTVFNVLVASPSDVIEERLAITQVIHEWNALNARETQKVLLPVLWETHSAPSMGDRPQGIINEKIVKGCDMLIGAFWTRLGSPTGKEDSGTVEEIKWFLDQKKPVMLYFSKAPVPQEKIDPDQLKKLRDFRSSIRNRGIQEEYPTVDSLKEKLTRQLTIVARDMSTGPFIDKRIVREAKESTKADAPGEVITTSAVGSQMGSDIYFEDYTEKSFIVRGDTRTFKSKLHEAGGRWIPTKTGPKGWMFAKRHLAEVAALLGVPAVLGR